MGEVCQVRCLTLFSSARKILKIQTEYRTCICTTPDCSLMAPPGCESLSNRKPTQPPRILQESRMFEKLDEQDTRQKQQDNRYGR